MKKRKFSWKYVVDIGIDIFLIILILFVCGSILSGCSQKTPVVYQNLYVKPPEALMISCPVPKPIGVESYLAYDLSQRERYLTDLVIDLYSSISQCNTRLKGLRVWSSEVDQLQQK